MNLARQIQFILDERTVKIIKDLLKAGDTQVVDLGVHGWFHLFTAMKTPPKSVNKKIITTKQYQKGVDAGELHVDPIVNNRSTYAMAKDTTKALTKLGMKRQKAVVVIQDLGTKKNSITGGGVGGFADFTGHGLSVGTATVLGTPDFAVELLAHEWGHAQWRQFSKAQKGFISQWYSDNVIEGPKKRGVSVNVMNQIADVMWDSFSDLFKNNNGAGADEFMELARKVRDAPDSEIDPWEFFGSLKNVVIRGRMKKQVKAAEAILFKSESPTDNNIKTSFRKGEKVEVVSDGPGLWQFFVRRDRAKQYLRSERDMSMDKIRSMVDIDIRATEEANPGVTMHGAVFGASTLIKVAAGDPNAGSVTLEMVLGAYDPKEVGISNAFDVAIQFGTDAVKQLVDNLPVGFLKKARLALFSDWRAGIRKEGFNLVPSILFKKLIKEYMEFGWQLIPKDTKLLNQPQFSWFRAQAKNFGSTPSAYGASNDLELWAETIAYAATKANQVPKPVMAMFRAVIQGKTSNESRKIIDWLTTMGCT